MASSLDRADAAQLGALAVDACRRISAELQAFGQDGINAGGPAFPVSRVR